MSRTPGIARRLTVLTELFLIWSLAAVTAYPCSTFLLHRDPTLIVGHNLDQDFHTPGALFVNPRGEVKQNRNGSHLGLAGGTGSTVYWISRFGSVTFSILGRGFPDGGVNEAGLVVSEMALGQSRFPTDLQKPVLFIHQWIQYQLDNYATVEACLRHLGDLAIDPRATFSPVSQANYHFFIADASGRSAIIEFLGSQPVIHRDADLKVPALCNMPYAYELNRLEKVSGFAGWLQRWLDSDNDQRFLVCADGLREFDPDRHGDGTKYALDLLTRMQFDSTRQWSILYDISDRKISFRTAASPGVKTLDLERVPFTPSAGVRILKDIDAVPAADVSAFLEPFNEELNQEVIERFLRSLMSFVSQSNAESDFDKYLREQHGLTFREYLAKAHQVSVDAHAVSTN